MVYNDNLNFVFSCNYSKMCPTNVSTDSATGTFVNESYKSHPQTNWFRCFQLIFKMELWLKKRMHRTVSQHILVKQLLRSKRSEKLMERNILFHSNFSFDWNRDANSATNNPPGVPVVCNVPYLWLQKGWIKPKCSSLVPAAFCSSAPLERRDCSVFWWRAALKV